MSGTDDLSTAQSIFTLLSISAAVSIMILLAVRRVKRKFPKSDNL